jgi:hypothetical protein
MMSEFEGAAIPADVHKSKRIKPDKGVVEGVEKEV